MQSLRILPLKLTLESIDLALNTHAGNLWRSGLGLALKQHFPDLFALLFAENARLGRLYALRPPLEAVRPGQGFELGIRLFGPACEHALACTHAIARLGEIGLGERRQRFRLLQAAAGPSSEQIFFDAQRGLLDCPQPVGAEHWLDVCEPGHGRAIISFTTPVALKAGNRLHEGPISFTQLTRRLHGRLAQLSEAAGELNPLGRERANAQLAGSDQIVLLHSQLKRSQVKRHSARSGQTMQFAGLVGTHVYHGQLGPYAGLLRLAEIMQIGGKTAFGFGCLSNTFTWEE